MVLWGIMGELSSSRFIDLSQRISANPRRHMLPFALEREGEAVMEDGQDLVVLSQGEHQRYRAGRGRCPGWRGWLFLKEDTVWASDGKEHLAFNPKGEPRAIEAFPEPAGTPVESLREQLNQARAFERLCRQSSHPFL